MVDFFERLLPNHSFLGKLFKNTRESTPYTERELAAELIKMGYDNDISTAPEYLPELLGLRASRHPDGCFAFVMQSREQEKPRYVVRGNVHMN